MAENVGFFGVAVATGVVAKVAEVGNPICLGLAAAAFGVCLGVKSFLKVEVPKIAPKARKISKKEKRAKAAKAAALIEDEVEAARDAKAEAKQLKKRAKERAKKEAKRAAKAEAAAAEAAAAKAQSAKAEAKDGEKKLTKEQLKKKKQKEKQKAKKAAKKAAEAATAPKKAAPKAVEPVGTTEEVAADVWEEVKVKKNKKQAVVVEASAVVYTTDIYIERKFFGTILGSGGSTLKSITAATGTEIELPKEGGMRPDILISGPSQEACTKAKKALMQLVTKGYSDITHAGTVDDTIKVPDNKRAVLIGPRGATIHLLQDKLSVKINIPDKGSDSDEVSVVGDEENVAKAIAAIKQLITIGYSDVTHENYTKIEIEVPRDDLKKLIGPGGSIIRGLQDATRTKVNVPQNCGNIAFVTLLGEAEDVAECRVKIAELLVPDEVIPVPEEWSQAASIHYVTAW